MEYVDIINRIVEAEHEGQRQTDEALSRRETLADDLKQESGKIRESYMERARNRVEKVRQQERQLADSQIEELEKQLEDDLWQTQELFETHKQAWAETIFQKILEE